MSVIKKIVGVLLGLGLSSVVVAHGKSAHSAHEHGHQHQTGHNVAMTKGSATALTFDRCWARFNPTGASALYVDILNHDSKQSAYIVDVASPKFKRAVLHETYEKEGVAGMRHLSEIMVPAHSLLVFAPGKYHVMMFEPHHVNIGDKVSFTFTLSNGHALKTRCDIKPVSAGSYTD